MWRLLRIFLFATVARSSAIRLAPEVARAARALRAEGKELAHVLAELRRRCGPRVLRSQAGREATIRVAYVGRGNQQPEWTVIARLANAERFNCTHGPDPHLARPLPGASNRHVSRRLVPRAQDRHVVRDDAGAPRERVAAAGSGNSRLQNDDVLRE